VKNCFFGGMIYASELSMLRPGYKFIHQVFLIPARLIFDLGDITGTAVDMNIGLRGTK